MTKNNPSPVLFRFFTEIGIIDQLIQTKLERVLPDGLKTSQFGVLNHLVRLEGEWSPLRLANSFQVTKAAMTNTLSRLENKKLIRVLPNPKDGRAKIVKITPSGRKMHQRCVNKLSPFFQQIDSELGINDFESALPNLEAVREYLDKNR